MKTIVIGAGIGGLASAIRLALLGHEVEVYEAQATYGGKVTELSLGKYRFDAGPSLCTLPHLIDELFLIGNKNPREYINFDSIPLSHRAFFNDGQTVDISTDFETLIAQCAEHFTISQTRMRKYLNFIRRQYQLTAPHFLDSDSLTLSSFFSAKMLYAALRYGIIKPLSTVHSVNARYLQDPRLVQIFDRFATYNGSNPYRAPGILTLIAYVELGLGAYMPKGGIIAIANALYTYACELGVRFIFNTKIHRIVTKKVSSTICVQGVCSDDTMVCADAIVSNMDVSLTYTLLLKEDFARFPFRLKKDIRRWQTQASSSALVFYWAMNRSYKQLDVHNIFFSSDYKAEFSHVFDFHPTDSVFHDPTVYVHVSSKINSEDAPKGCENWFVMLNVASDRGQDWDSIAQDARARIVTKLSPHLDLTLDKHIVDQAYLTPRDIAGRTLSAGGALYGSNSNTIRNALIRHPNTSPYVKGLFFCGGSVHPGGGIPLCLASAKRVAHAISRGYQGQ